MSSEQDLSLESLYRSSFNQLKTIAYSQIRNMPMAEELAQETFLVALKDYEVFREHEQPLAYLKKALNYKIREYNREVSRYHKLFFSMDRELTAEVKAPSNSSPISAPGILEMARETLTDDEWYILWKFAMEGASHLQIAKSLGISVPASYKRLERIREKLRNVLPEH